MATLNSVAYNHIMFNSHKDLIRLHVYVFSLLG